MNPKKPKGLNLIFTSGLVGMRPRKYRKNRTKRGNKAGFINPKNPEIPAHPKRPKGLSFAFIFYPEFILNTKVDLLKLKYII